MENQRQAAGEELRASDSTVQVTAPGPTAVYPTPLSWTTGDPRATPERW